MNWLIQIGRGGPQVHDNDGLRALHYSKNGMTIYMHLNELYMKITTLCHMLMSRSESYCVQYVQEKSSQPFMENENHPYHSAT